MTAGGLADVAGLRIGHCTAVGDGYLTGTTVVLAPDRGMVAGVDVRGGGPGTRETDLLAPNAAMDRVHAVVLSGGSAFGLAAADGVMAALAERGIGFRVGEERDAVVPIVPAAVIFDLGRGGDFGRRPDVSFGGRAVHDALTADPAAMHAEGSIGAGTGALTGGMRGGIGHASVRMGSGPTVAALVVANASGAGYDTGTGELWATRYLKADDDPPLSSPTPAERSALAGLDAENRSTRSVLAARAWPAAAIRNTTLGVVATDATLTKALCGKLAAVAHDGLARAVNPVHSMFDGDLFFGVSTATQPAPDPAELYDLLDAAAAVVTRAIGRALLAATGLTTPAGTFRAYRDLAPSGGRRR